MFGFELPRVRIGPCTETISRPNLYHFAVLDVCNNERIAVSIVINCSFLNHICCFYLSFLTMAFQYVISSATE